MCEIKNYGSWIKNNQIECSHEKLNKIPRFSGCEKNSRIKSTKLFKQQEISVEITKFFGFGLNSNNAFTFRRAGNVRIDLKFLDFLVNIENLTVNITINHFN